ncbi:MAG: UDP-glucose 4-epimerase GalE [Bacilli bacterium]|nr:UDP-glucose 4-epimerase GalE [Bacilli bacterium]
MSILVTGGTGYIGSHTVVDLLNNGYEVVIVDNYVNSKPEVLNRINQITGKTPKFYEADVRDEIKMRAIFENEMITDVIHFAGLKSVAESVAKPELYIDNNIGSTKVLLKLMKEYGVTNLVFSSSATVYGVPKRVPLSENDPVGGCTNPYGQTKLDIEFLLKDYAKENPYANIAILRYFNPIGAHASGLIGEDPNGIPNNLMPYVTQVAIGKREHLNVYGNDYKTVDGTGVRDYIHVVDLARGHLCAIRKLQEKPGLVIYNLGTGKGTSVLELVHAFEEANGLKIPYVICERRPGDVDENYAKCDKAYKEMGFKTQLTVLDACRDSWNWQKNNPRGYDK